VARDTKLGQGRDHPRHSQRGRGIPGQSGRVRDHPGGAEINPGDILVGKITPKGETQLSPEEKLLRAIFGEKASDVKDTSLRVPPGVEGIVIDARVFSRKGVDKDERAQSIEDEEVNRLMKDQEDEIRIIMRTHGRLAELLVGKNWPIRWATGKESDPLRRPHHPGKRRRNARRRARVSWPDKSQRKRAGRMDAPGGGLQRAGGDGPQPLRQQDQQAQKGRRAASGRYQDGQGLRGHEAQAVNVGDKMAGRHGNKGVVSRILPDEDMPHFEGRNAGGHRAQPPGRAFAHERGPDFGNPFGLGQPGWAEIGRMLVDEMNQEKTKRKLEKGLAAS
jgi:DNA-directed RNA polymerase subunit beta